MSALSIYSKGKFDKEDYKDHLFGIKGLGGFLILMGDFSKLNQTRKMDKNAFDMMAYSVSLFER